MNKASLAAQANLTSAASYREGAPTLTAESTPEEVAAWLQWCDPNGCHKQALAIAEGCDPYDAETAWEALASMIGEEPTPDTTAAILAQLEDLHTVADQLEALAQVVSTLAGKINRPLTVERAAIQAAKGLTADERIALAASILSLASQYTDGVDHGG